MLRLLNVTRIKPIFLKHIYRTFWIHTRKKRPFQVMRSCRWFQPSGRIYVHGWLWRDKRHFWTAWYWNPKWQEISFWIFVSRTNFVLDTQFTHTRSQKKAIWYHPRFRNFDFLSTWSTESFPREHATGSVLCSNELIDSEIPSWLALSFKISVSEMTTNSVFSGGSLDSSAQISGPIPAGSPGVIAILCITRKFPARF